MHLFGRRILVASTLLIGVLGFSSVTYGQTDPPPETVAPDPASAPVVPAPTEPSTAPTEPTTPKTTTTLAPCEKTADLAVVFVGRPVVRAGTIVTFRVDSVVTGEIASPTTNVNFPLDDRFLFDSQSYRVAASLDAESKTFVSKVRPQRNTPPHCLAKDKVFTVHEDGSEIDTGIFAGMSGNWKRVPLTLVEPLGGAMGALLALVILKHSLGWIGRWLYRLGKSNSADA